jgi:protein-S-isoprenylcysteine O-methyltransferase Ste14
MGAVAAAARRWQGRALVALQFGLLAGLAWATGGAWRSGAAPWAGWGLLGCSAALGLWAMSANRPGNFNIQPLPRAGGVLVQHGPYRWVRHPMYTAVLAFGAACALAAGTAGAVAAALALLPVLWVKAGLEERWMAELHPAYADYRRRTRRFVPGLL